LQDATALILSHIADYSGWHVAKINKQEFNKQQQINEKIMSKEKPQSFAEAVSKG